MVDLYDLFPYLVYFNGLCVLFIAGGMIKDYIEVSYCLEKEKENKKNT